MWPPGTGQTQPPDDVTCGRMTGRGLRALELGLINRVAAPRQHEDRRVGGGPQLPAHIQAVHVGQHQIENDGVILGSRQAFETRSP